MLANIFFSKVRPKIIFIPRAFEKEFVETYHNIVLLQPDVKLLSCKYCISN